jgi:adenylate cyclase
VKRLSRALSVGILTGIVGLGSSILPPALGFDLEENLGLGLLFSLRGAREPPPGVLIVAMDKASADNLDLKVDPDEWPRPYHARLVEKLAGEGATLIAFDIFFEKPGIPEQDASFAESMTKAGNVILCARIEKQKRPAPEEDGLRRGDLSIETLVQPVDTLARSAVATAAFPLPKIPVKVSQYWTFKTGAGEAPSLPVVVFHMLALRHYEDFVRVMKTVDPSRAASLPPEAAPPAGSEEVTDFVRALREIFLEDPRVAEQMLKVLEGEGHSEIGDSSRSLLNSLLRLHREGHSRYLNFFGPPGTIRTISYEKALGLGGKAPGGTRTAEVSGKVVFVGLSERHQPEQRDGFTTVFSQPDGTDLSGVEIAATAFANLVEDLPIRPLGQVFQLALFVCWGLILGLTAVLLPITFAAAGVVLLVFLYGTAAAHQFQHAGVWYPMVTTLMVQAPFAIAVSVLWKSATTHRTIRRLVPGPGVDHTGSISTVSKRIFGVCLFSDVKGFTAVSEEMDPIETTRLMNSYFEAISAPVIRHRGTVYEYEGDSMMAGWESSRADTDARRRVCSAALEIYAAAERFSQSSGARPLHTRTGLHAGLMNRSNVGARDHCKYTIMGDTVNTASRLEALNKQLNTWILVSGDVLDGVDGFLTREVGEFVLVGKSRQVSVHELICPVEVATGSQRDLCETFSDALAAFRRRDWEGARDRFEELVAIFGEDGPSAYYIDLCRTYAKDPPGEDWSGLIYLDRK